MIQVLDWLYENELRAFPFKESAIKLDVSHTYKVPNNLVLDAQFTFEAHPGDFKITSITNTSDTDVVFTFSNTTTLTVAKGITEPTYVRTSTGKLMVFGLGLNDVPIGTFAFTSLIFEPSTVLQFGGPWKGVSSIIFDASTPLTGVLNFIEGYQFELFMAANSIRFAIGNIYGTPIGCTMFGANPEDCNDIISSINGVGPDGNKEILLKAGNGFVVWDDPPNHRIYIGFAFTSAGDICGDIPPFPV